MRFIDEMTISVTGGRGGNGCMSFRREKFLPNGGPDGGNGGRGGSVRLIATTALQTLADLERRRHYAAENGDHGKGAAKNGAAGEDLIIKVPCGTMVLDAETGDGLADLVEPGDSYVAAMGGRGGRGNRVFASSQRRAPRFSEKGEIGESNHIKLKLKLIADIGLVGLPNVGKSSILAAISRATPKIADYPFTTLSPNLGVIRDDEEEIVIADIPGLIEGASDDRGLGLQFLRHIERTRSLVHVLDISSGDVDSIMRDFDVVRDELSSYDPDLVSRPFIAAGNKIDLVDDGRDMLLDDLAERFSKLGAKFIGISAFTGENVDALAHEILDFSRLHPRPRGSVRLFASQDDAEEIAVAPMRRKKQQVTIISLPDGSFRVLHPQMEKAAERYDLSQDESVARFMKLIRKYRVEELLEAAGALHGDLVCIGRTEFTFSPD